MLKSSNPTRRIAGRLLVVTGIAAALPLTASRAVDYVDVAAPASPAAAAPVASAPSELAKTVAARPVGAARPAAAPNAVAAAVPVSISAAVAAPTPAVRVRDSDNLTIRDNLVTIDGVTKRWEDLTPAEMARVRAAVAKARVSLDNTHIDQARLMRDVASIPDQAQMAALQRELAGAHARLSESVRRIDERAARDRAAGREPDQLDAAVRVLLQSVQAKDLDSAARALAGVDRQKIASEVGNAQTSMEAAKAELARIQARLDSEQHR